MERLAKLFACRRHPVFMNIRTLLIAFILLTPFSCRDDDPFFRSLDLPYRFESEHFVFHYDEKFDPALAESVKDSLEKNYQVLLDDMQPGSIEKTTIALWSDKQEFAASQYNRYPGAVGYVVSKREVRVLAIGVSTNQVAIHEFVHALTLYINDDFANNPRWLWESIAVYEAKQFIDPTILPFMTSGDYPSMESLDQEQGTEQRIYKVGFTIAEFIIKTWGVEKLHALVESNGNVEKTLGISMATFEQQWYQFVRDKYF